MTDEARRERVKRLRELARAGEAVWSRGLTTRPSREAIEKATAVVAAKLGDRIDPARAGAAAALAHRLLERSLAAEPETGPLACKRGCGWCCYGYVAVTAPEVFHLAAAVRRAARGDPFSALEAVSARAAPLRGLDPAARLGRKLPCPLLREGACSHYAARPLMCRKVVSRALAPCLEEFEGSGADLELPARHAAHADNATLVLLAALVGHGRAPVSYELSEALVRVLGEAQAETRWLAGEDVLAGVQRAPPYSREVMAVVEALARAVGPDAGPRKPGS
jgi:hypothetical protein